MISITRRFEFCAGHRINRHESKCRNIHGHNWSVEVQLTPIDGKQLDSLGRVLDFSEVKRIIGGWIDENLDHGMILSNTDDLAELWNPAGLLNDHKLYLMDCNPTAENLAIHIRDIANDLLDHASVPLRACKVTVHETANCSATVEER